MFVTKKMTRPIIATAVAAVLAGCASTPQQDPRISNLESQLRAAYSDKYIAEYGHGDLAKAEASLATARVAIRKGRDSETQHELSMAESHIGLGQIHGKQERAKAETVALKDRQQQIVLAARDRDIRQANSRAADSQADAAAANAATQDANVRADASQANAVAADAATQNANDRAEASRADAAAANVATQNAQAATQTAQDKVAAMRDQLRVYDMKYTELGATLVLRDVLFAVDSSQLRAGAVNRLDPLISYLVASPGTSVRIEGHTDNSGSIEYNNELSLDRANSVKRALLSNTTVANSIETLGYGQSKPVSTNATVSGREQNRRVEITLQ